MSFQLKHVGRLILAAGLVGLATAAPAQTRYLGAYGPIVLPVDPGTGRPYGEDPRDRRAVPVPSVMNGGGYGLTGVEYYNDGLTEGRLDRRPSPREYVLAPALREPPLYARP